MKTNKKLVSLVLAAGIGVNALPGTLYSNQAKQEINPKKSAEQKIGLDFREGWFHKLDIYDDKNLDFILKTHDNRFVHVRSLYEDKYKETFKQISREIEEVHEQNQYYKIRVFGNFMQDEKKGQVLELVKEEYIAIIIYPKRAGDHVRYITII